MRWVRSLTAMTLGIVLWTGLALAQGQPARCDKSKTPEKLEGRVTKIDLDHGKVIVEAKDGTTHEFQASKETLQGYKVGDPIEAKLRSAPDCK